MHFHVPNYYLYSIPLSVIIGLIFLVYFGFKFGEESRIRKRAYDKIQELMARESELLSLGAQAAASAHSLGTPLSTILLTATELKKEFGNIINVNDLKNLPFFCEKISVRNELNNSQIESFEKKYISNLETSASYAANYLVNKSKLI